MNKNNIKLILKGILLWITILTIVIFITGIDSICDNGYFIPMIILCVILGYSCYRTISEKELEIISFYKFFNDLIGEDFYKD